MARSSVVALALSAGGPVPVFAGPPFETDDPAPTATRHWEVYLFTNVGGRGAEFDGSGGADINHGVLPGVQATVTLPLDIASHDGPAVAASHADLGMKYRFWSQWNGGGSAAIAPVLSVPLHPHGGDPARLGVTLPIWIGFERNGWTIYGGGGRTFSGDSDGRDSLFGGFVVARNLTPNSQLGVELTWHGPEHVDEGAEVGVDLGCIVPLTRALALHASAGPRFLERESPRYRLYVGLATQF